MSVYTTISHHELETFLSHYTLGQLETFEGINAGIENTNYFVKTTKGWFVLTIFESLLASELPYFLDLMAYFAEHDIPSAHPLADKQKHYLRQLKGKPAALVQRLSGNSIEHPKVEQCAALGKMLGKMHTVGQAFTGQRPNARGLSWCQQSAQKVLPFIDGEALQLLKNEIQFQTQFNRQTLAQGVIHADLFRDNALFSRGQLTGIIDFYYACNDILLYDVAVVVNDWCSQADGALDLGRVSALINAYVLQRPFDAQEKTAWTAMLRAAALRFWLSRLYDKYFPRDGEITHIKDPDVFMRILQQRIQQSPSLKLEQFCG